MAAAMELTRAGKKPLVIEKAAQVGGLAKTLEFREKSGVYRTDIGPHRFFSKNQYLYDFIGDLLGEKWRKVPRLTRFYIHGHFFLYPVRIGNVLKNIGLWRAIIVLRDYLFARIRRRLFPKAPRSFEDYAVSTFGRALAELNMLNYTEKIWGIPCTEISVDWANQRIGGLSLLAMIKNALFHTGGPKTLVDSFYYPSQGSGLIYEAIRERIEAKGAKVETSTVPTVIRHDGKRVTAVEVKGEKGVQTIHPESVVSSIPLNEVVKLFDPPPPAEVLQAARSLRFRAQVYLFLTVDRERIAHDNWIYFPDKEIPFGRISEMKNFSKEMCPEGKTSLFLEFFCFEGDEIWKMEKEELFDRTMAWLEKLELLKREEVMDVHHFRGTHVYPLYNLTYRKDADAVLRWLDRFENYHAIGRPGRFRYTNQDHSLEMGILAAQTVLDGRKRNIDEVGAEKEYFEKGYVPEDKK